MFSVDMITDFSLVILVCWIRRPERSKIPRAVFTFRPKFILIEVVLGLGQTLISSPFSGESIPVGEPTSIVIVLELSFSFDSADRQSFLETFSPAAYPLLL